MNKSIKKQLDNLLERWPVKHHVALREIHDMTRQGGVTDRTITVRYSLIKKKFREVTNDEAFLKRIRPATTLTNKVLKKNLETRDAKQMITVTKKHINTINSFKTAQHPHQLLVFLLFVSGRRTSEILNGKFRAVRNKPYTVQTHDLVKSRHKLSCRFDTLVPRKVFAKELKRFHKIMKDGKWSYKAVTVGISKVIKRKLGKEFHAHNLRSMYAAWMFKFRNTKNECINPFVKRVLCHVSIDSSLSYTSMRISPDIKTDIFE